MALGTCAHPSASSIVCHNDVILVQRHVENESNPQQLMEASSASHCLQAVAVAAAYHGAYLFGAPRLFVASDPS